LNEFSDFVNKQWEPQSVDTIEWYRERVDTFNLYLDFFADNIQQFQLDLINCYCSNTRMVNLVVFVFLCGNIFPLRSDVNFKKEKVISIKDFEKFIKQFHLKFFEKKNNFEIDEHNFDKNEKLKIDILFPKDYLLIGSKNEISKLNEEEEENYDENNSEDNVESLENKEQMIIDEIIDEEKNFQNEIFQQNIIIENLKERFNKAIEYQIKIKEKKKKEINLKKIKLINQKNNEKNTKIKYLNTNGKSLDYKININQTNKFNYKYGESPKNSREINKIKISLNKKPFKEIKFNEIYKNIIGQNYNKNKRNENIYRSFYDRSLESNNENVIYGQKHKNKISNDIEKLKNEITNALKNNIVFFNSPKNTTDITHNINNEKLNEFEINKEFNIKNNSKPFQKFNFN
jgi:hypothetical protein